MNTFRTLALAAGLALSPLLAPFAQAAIVQGSFQVTIDSAGDLHGQTFSGTFAFDDQAFTPFGGDEVSPLLDFSFDFDGASYTLLDLAYGDAVRSGGVFSGLDVGAANFSFLPALGGFDASFAYDFGVGETGSGGVTFELLPPQPVPEPAGAALLATALLAAAATLRRRRR